MTWSAQQDRLSGRGGDCRRSAAGQGVPEVGLGGGVQGGGDVVQHQQVGSDAQGAGLGEALRLPAGQP
jgi:hypothetical protein